jgi:hypothetical protein
VAFDRSDRDEKATCDIGIAVTGIDQPEYLDLSRCHANSGEMWWNRTGRRSRDFGSDGAQGRANSSLECTFTARVAKSVRLISATCEEPQFLAAQKSRTWPKRQQQPNNDQ